jgi:hypothetical protein
MDLLDRMAEECRGPQVREAAESLAMAKARSAITEKQAIKAPPNGSGLLRAPKPIYNPLPSPITEAQFPPHVPEESLRFSSRSSYSSLEEMAALLESDSSVRGGDDDLSEAEGGDSNSKAMSLRIRLDVIEREHENQAAIRRRASASALADDFSPASPPGKQPGHSVERARPTGLTAIRISRQVSGTSPSRR